MYVAEALLYLGRYEEVRQLLQEALVYTRRMHIHYITEAVSHKLAELDLLTGHWSAAVARLQTTFEPSGDEEPAGLFKFYASVLLGRLYNDLGLTEKAHRLLTEAVAGPVNSLDPRVALLGELARAEALRGQQDAAVAAAAEIVNLTGHARYLFPNFSMALLFTCRLPVMFSSPEIVSTAQLAHQQLTRLDEQYHTPATAACLLEGSGWLALVEGKAAEAAVAFQQAAARWQAIDHPYDIARTLHGLGQALVQADDRRSAYVAWEQAVDVINRLAAQLDDHELRAAFLNSLLVKEIRLFRNSGVDINDT